LSVEWCDESARNADSDDEWYAGKVFNKIPRNCGVYFDVQLVNTLQGA